MERTNNIGDIGRYLCRKWCWILCGAVLFIAMLLGIKFVSGEMAYKQLKGDLEAELTEEEREGILFYNQLEKKADEQKEYIDSSALFQIDAYNATYTVYTVKTSQELSVLTNDILKDLIELNDLDMTVPQIGEMLKQKFIAEEDNIYFWNIFLIHGNEQNLNKTLEEALRRTLTQNQIDIVGKAEEEIVDYELAKQQEEILSQYEETLEALEKRKSLLNQRQLVELKIYDKDKLCEGYRMHIDAKTLLTCIILGAALSMGIAVFIYIFDGSIHCLRDWYMVAGNLSTIFLQSKKINNDFDKVIDYIKTNLLSSANSAFGIIYTYTDKKEDRLKILLEKEFGRQCVEVDPNGEYISPLIVVVKEDSSKIQDIKYIVDKCSSEKITSIQGLYYICSGGDDK